MEVTLNPPPAPPPTTVTITLTFSEARRLARLLHTTEIGPVPDRLVSRLANSGIHPDFLIAGQTALLVRISD